MAVVYPFQFTKFNEPSQPLNRRAFLMIFLHHPSLARQFDEPSICRQPAIFPIVVLIYLSLIHSSRTHRVELMIHTVLLTLY